MTKAQPEWTKERLNALFLTNDRAVERAILFLYDRQTESEKRSGGTKEDNGRGFSGLDGRFLSSLGKRLRMGLSLTPGQLTAIRRLNPKGFCILAKYHGQLQDAIAAKKARVYAAIDAAEVGPLVEPAA